ncbi:MAG: patatin-like phospholipase family protein [Chitinophagaceae bacterium]|nr:patatin-like phospholipase family protein [Chitinophagaceae bacterium]
MSRALVISGGGSKGAFAVGVLKKLFNAFPELDFDIYVGTSTGSLMAPLVALKEMDMLEKLYSNQKTEDIVLTGRLGDRINDVSIFDASPLKSLLEKNYTDQRYNEIKASGKKIFLTTTCLQSEALVVFTTSDHAGEPVNYEAKKIETADHFRRAVLASACQPVFMQPVKVNKNIAGDPARHFQYVDGGVREYAGVQMAIDNGATEIFTILLSPEETTTDATELKDLFSILRKTIDIFTDDVGKNDLIIPAQYNEALQYIEAVKKKMIRNGISASQVKDFFTIRGRESPYEDKVPIKMYTFRPKAALNGGPGGLSFDPVAMKDMILKGEAIANDFIAALEPGDISWA